MILAVDTSLGTAVALVDADGRAVADASHHDSLGHAEVIGDLLTRVFAAAGAAPADVAQVVAGMGPGPFTGLRIGIAAARAFALGRGIEVTPAPSHFAAALSVIDGDPSTGSGNGGDGSGNGGDGSGVGSSPFAIVTDARRREVAVSIFEGLDADGIPNLISETVLVPRPEVVERLRGIHAIEVATLDAAALARVGLRARRAGRTLTGPEPLYLRQPDAAAPTAPKRVGL